MADIDPTTLGVIALGRAFRAGSLDPLDVTEAYLERCQPGSVYRLVTAERARRQAEASRRRFRAGVDAGPLDGVPLALKDLIDTAGDVTGAGSPPLIDGPPAQHDAPVAARLGAAGAVFLGKTTMTELAFSGIGINPHVGTPPNAYDPARVPGGSSSGSAVAVATGLACAAVGSDTGGSVRIPASFNGLAGLKTTDGALPMEGTVPLSTTLDTLGPIARSCDDAWALMSAMRGAPPSPLPEAPLRWRLWAPAGVAFDHLDAGVARAVDAALDRIAAAGHVIEREPLPELGDLDDLYARFGSFAAHEAFAHYEAMLERDGDRMDPRVVQRILAVRGRPSSDYIRLRSERERLRQEVWGLSLGVDALVLPTVAVSPPLTEALIADDDAFFRANLQVLRLTTLGNLLGGPVATVPVGVDEHAVPVGLSLAAAPGEDALALSLARGVARLLGTDPEG
jgi:aspartyl-tRNA(Asn)/glutamyl-tRNA(Gln) amidotransferase subunit A